MSNSITPRALGALTFTGIVCASSVALAAGGGDAHFPWPHYAASWVNFAIFAAILWKFALPPIQRYFKARRGLLEASLLEAERLRAEAEAQLEVYRSKIAALESERATLLDEYNEQGEREKAKIIAEAKRGVEKMRADAERLIDQEVKKAIAGLEQRAVDHAVEMAEQIARQKLSQESAQKALVDSYISDLESMDKLSA